MSSSLHINNSNKKDIFILGKSPTYGFDDVTLTAEKRYAINFTEQQKQFCLSLHYNGLNSYIFVNGIEIYKFKAKESVWTMFQKKFSVDNMTNTALYGYEYDFSVDFASIDNADILDTRVLIKFCKTRFL